MIELREIKILEPKEFLKILYHGSTSKSSPQSSGL